MAIQEEFKKNKNLVKLKINLEELFGEEVVDSPGARQVLAQEIIDRITAQAEAGENKKGKKFTGQKGKYSDEYADSLRFKAFGKSKGDVTMTQTGSMLSNMTLLRSSKNSIEIGWDPGSEDGQKAHGHITGKEGKVPAMKRDFFGLSNKEYDTIANNLKGQFESEEDIVSSFRSTLEQSLSDVLSTTIVGAPRATTLDNISQTNTDIEINIEGAFLDILGLSNGDNT